MPLYPQYCAATTATVCDEVFRVLSRLRYQPAVRIAPLYYNDTVYIEALGSSTGAELSQLSFKPEVVLASFHGVPKAYVDNGDPYFAHCVETVRLLRERLNLEQSKLTMTFQSRFGRGKWLEPAIHHDELRFLHRVEQLERFADKLVGPHGLRLRRHHLLDFEVEQVGAHVPAQVPVGDDAHEMAAAVGDADAAEGLGRHLGDRFRHAGAHRGERRSEEHTSELQSHSDLVCRLLLEKKKKDKRSAGSDR